MEVPVEPLVAVIVKLPVFEIVTACDDRTPEENVAVVPEPEERVPVEVMVTVLEKLVTVLLFASCATTLMLKEVPAVCVPIELPEVLVTAKWWSTPGSTVNELEVPASAPPVLVAVMVKLPVLEIVTACDDRTPEENEAVVPEPADNVPVEVISTVPLNEATVLLLASLATILILNDEPAVCVPMEPSEVLVTTK